MRTSRIVIALVVGLALGAIGAWAQWPFMDQLVAIAGTIGGLWVDALRMTVIPLVFALVVTGIAAAAATASAGRLSGKILVVFAGMMLAASAVCVAVTAAVLAGWSPAPDTLSGLRDALGGATVPELPGGAESLRAVIPSNPIAAAAEGAILPLALFALIFGLAAARLPDGRGAPLIAMFELVSETMLKIVQWVLAAAPIGVAALAFVVAARLGIGAGLLLVQEMGLQILLALILIALLYPLTVAAGRVPLRRFAVAAAPVQAVAASTQSSIACLSPMVTAADAMGLNKRSSALVLPMAVAIFKISAPVVVAVVTLGLAKVYGVELGMGDYLLLVLLGAVNTVVVVGLPGAVSFFAAAAPPLIALGIPIELLPLLLAVDAIPDIVRTVANVTADLSAAAIVGRGEPEPAPERIAAEVAAPAEV